MLLCDSEHNEMISQQLSFNIKNRRLAFFFSLSLSAFVLKLLYFLSHHFFAFPFGFATEYSSVAFSQFHRRLSSVATVKFSVLSSVRVNNCRVYDLFGLT